MDDALTQRRVFRTVTALIGGEAALFTLVIPALPIFADRYDLSNSAVVLIFGIFPLTQLMATPVVAGVIDRTGRRPIMLGGAFGLLAATAGFALADSVPLLMATRGLQGAAAALVWIAGVAAISDIYPQNQLGFRLGLAETIGGAIGLIGPVAGGALIEWVGTEEAFAIATLLPLVLLVMALRVPETARFGDDTLSLGDALRRIVHQPEAKAGILSLLCFSAVLAVVDSLLALDLDERLGASTATIGVVFGIGLLGLAVFAPVAGAWSDRHGRRAPVLAGAVICAASLPFIAIGPIWAVTAAFFVLGCGLATLAAPSSALVVAAADKSGMEGMYGVTSGIIVLIFALGYALGPMLGAASVLALSLVAVCIIGSMLVLLAGVAVYRLLPPGA